MKQSKYFSLLLMFACAGCSSIKPDEPAAPTNDITKRAITVDADISDWQGVPAHRVEGAEHLWFGQGMTPEKWKGNADHSFQWRTAWYGNKLYFLFEVTDDIVVDPAQQPNSFLNECIEILLDPHNQGGPLWVENAAGEKTFNGYEMHFLPSEGQPVFIDDYVMDKPQTERFNKTWDGETAARKTETGYIMEVAFTIPDVELKPGLVMGMEIGIGDDDGQRRKSLQTWTGKQVDFWLTMDHYNKVTLVD